MTSSTITEALRRFHRSPEAQRQAMLTRANEHRYAAQQLRRDGREAEADVQDRLADALMAQLRQG